MLSNQDLICLLNGDRDIDISIKTEKTCKATIDNIFAVYSKYMLWSYEEFENAVNIIEQAYENYLIYSNTTHKGIFERMKEHTSIKEMSNGEKLVKSILDKKKYTYKQECYIGKSFDDGHSIRLDFVIFNSNTLHVIEYNGKQHYQAVEKFGGEKRFAIQKNNDNKKKQFCKKYGIPLLEIPYTATKEDIEIMIQQFIGDAK